ncbi:MAG: response regulator [Methylotenera sp.]|nr:response regulator [Oligoflexia bacterium]
MNASTVDFSKNFKKVLIVEDDTGIRESLRHYLNYLGLANLTAMDGVEAIKILKAEKIDVILTDFQMPRLNGIELLHWCRSQNLHIPVIFISANSHLVPQEQIALSEDCCATLMGKPIDLDILEQALTSAVEHTHHRNCIHSGRSNP